jgi:VanZ family protein
MATDRNGGGPGALSRWAPVAAWCAVIAVFSGDAFSGGETRQILLPALALILPGASPETLLAVHDVVRKLAHPAEYAVLAWLAARAFARPERPARATWAFAILLCLVWATLDELHQATLASRTGAASDVLLDAGGAVAGLLLREGVRLWSLRAVPSRT